MVEKDNPRETEADDSDKDLDRPAYYVGIGASAGGLEAIEAFFEHMGIDSGMAFIVVQHLSPQHKSLMVEILSKRTRMNVCRAEKGLIVEANTIYLIPPKTNLSIFHGKLVLTQQKEHGGLNLPIDIFLRSLAEDQGERSIGVILSGTGSDGMRGVRAIKENGGMVMVQDEQSAKFDGMPRSAISTGLADFILPPEDMPSQLIHYMHHPCMSSEDYSEKIASDEDNLTRVFSLLRENTGVDFTYYKPSTITRRLERRMTVNQLERLEDYVRYMEKYPEEIAALYRELLIGVTSFFRDKEAWHLLRQKAMPEILENIDEGDVARFWVVACSTGEEAYSLAILTHKCLEELGLKRQVKIFATDIDKGAIEKAGMGVYPESIAGDIDPEILSRYFVRKDDKFQVIPKIREMVVFAPHNVLKDPPFRRIHLVCCRNFLIYLQPVLQKKVLSLFHFSLTASGVLMLGTSETVGEMGDFFKALDTRNKIYRTIGANRTPQSDLFDLAPYEKRGAPPSAGAILPPVRRRISQDHLLTRMLELIGSKFAPTCIFVNGGNEIIHIIGPTEDFLHVPTGKMQNDVLKMVVEDISIPLATALQNIANTNEEVAYSNIHLRDAEGNVKETVHMRVCPVPGRRDSESLRAIFIEKSKTEKEGVDPEAAPYNAGKEMQQRIMDLEQELQYTRENLQATIEQLETSNEELQATNEELLASNEELQSTNEELQSVNEELYTVNSEYQAKIQELTQLNNDMDNLLRSTEIGTIFLDEDMRIRKYTPAANEVLKVLDQDLGRPISHLSHNLKNVNIVEIASDVQRSALPDEREVQTLDGHSYLMRTLPYHLDKRTVSGTVVTFINIDELKSAMTALAESEEHFRLFFETTPEMVHVTKYATGEIVAVNQVFLDQMGYKREDVIGKTTLELGEWPNPDSRKAFLEMLNAEGHVRNMQGNYRDKKGHEHPWLLSAKSIQLDGQKHILAIARDISELRETQRDLRLSEAFINVALDAGKVALWDVNLETGEVTTRGLLEMLGFEPEDVPENLAGWMADLVHPDDREDVDEKIRKCTSGEIEKYSTDHRLRKKDGTDLWVYAAGKLFKDAHKVQHLIGTSVDVTPRYSKMKEKLEDK